ncbi:GGDEF domain-containing protein [Acetobacter fallax]|uniref:Diguanylate cyclase n=1 Tax=Acetobacter fallax TaxID=1737473 RepID=A0ABX0K999_9PROT|nr:GGDEF domain-containing protein [Acetobacter fallax]NHO31776.1 diguanylate cyclase [Acetobacter fallax]NHO35335.1 diguanylate cyclase [Acetobacter fallax]
MEPEGDSDAEDYRALYLRTRRRLERERKIRREAEAIAERGLRELYRLNAQQKLLETIVSCANTTSSTRCVLKVALEETCKGLGLTGGVAFLKGKHGFGLIDPDLCTPDTPAALKNIRIACEASGLFESGGLAAQITDEQKIISWTIGQDKDTTAAFSHGLGLPVIAGGVVRALLIFFSCAEVRAEEPIVGLCMNIGGHIARVMEREQAEQKLRHDASHDALTGLPNRTHFNRKLADTVRSWNSTTVPPAICVIDLDHFKQINDSFGHAVGDMFLAEAAHRLAECTDPYPGCTLARIGGDEFMACLTGLPDAAEAVLIADRLCRVFDRPFFPDGHELMSSASVGIAFWTTPQTAASQILHAADSAMYASKKRGGGIVTIAER